MGTITPEDISEINYQMQNINRYINISSALSEINTNYTILSSSLQGIKACDNSLDKMNNLKNNISNLQGKASRVLTEVTEIIERNQGMN